MTANTVIASAHDRSSCGIRRGTDKDRRDQRSGVADTDPEDEGDDVHAPHHRRVVPRDAEPAVDLVHPRRDPDEQEEHGNAESNEPPDGWVKRADDLAIDLLVILHRRQLNVCRGDVRPAWLVARG